MVIQFIIIGIFILYPSYHVGAQTADGACSGGAQSLEQSCTFQQGSSRLNGKCQVKDNNNPGAGLTCRTSLGSPCSGDTCENGLACISNFCTRPRGTKTENQSCSGNECAAGLECRGFVCVRESTLSGTTPPNTTPAGGSTSALPGSAGTETGLVKCGVSRDCTICDIFILIRDIFTFALGLLASLAVLSMVIGGIYILVSAGNSGLVTQGYSIITNAVVGLLLVMASFLLFSFLLVSLGFQEANFSAVLTFQPGRLFEVKCDNASAFNDNGQNGGGQATAGGGNSGVVPAGGTVSPQEIRSLALGAGFTAEQARIMEAIAMAESTGNSRAHNTVPPDNSYGLWQINMLGALGPERRAQLGLSRNEQLFDPATNARAAKAIFDSQGLGAWSVYRSGAYRRFLRNP